MPTPFGASLGRLFLLKVTDGISPADYTTIGGMKATSMSVANAVVDVTTKDEAPWKTLLANAGDRSLSMSVSGVCKDDAGLNYLRSRSFDGAVSNFEIVDQAGDVATGSFLISKFEYTGASNGALEYSATIESTGTVTFTAHA